MLVKTRAEIFQFTWRKSLYCALDSFNRGHGTCQPSGGEPPRELKLTLQQLKLIRSVTARFVTMKA